MVKLLVILVNYIVMIAGQNKENPRRYKIQYRDDDIINFDMGTQDMKDSQRVNKNENARDFSEDDIIDYEVGMQEMKALLRPPPVKMLDDTGDNKEERILEEFDNTTQQRSWDFFGADAFWKKGVFQDFGSKLSETAASAKMKMSEAYNSTSKGLKTFGLSVESAASKAKEKVKSILDSTGSCLKKTYGKVKDAVVGAYEWTADGVRKIGNAVYNAISRLGKAIKDVFTSSTKP